MQVPNFDNLKGSQFTEKHFQIHYREYYQYVMGKYPDTPISFQEKLYWEIHHMTDPGRCATCGKPTRFENFNKGYRKYCSRKCMNSNPDKIANTKAICQERYGGVAPSCSEEIRNKMQQTCLDRYGVRNAMQNENIKKKSMDTIQQRYGGQGNASTILMAKRLDTMLVKYGSDKFNNREQYRETCLERYGYEYAPNNPHIQEKMSQGRRSSFLQSTDKVLGYTEKGEWICACPHPECTKCTPRVYVIPSKLYVGRENDGTEPCTNLLPIGSISSTLEIKVREWLDEVGIQYETNNRSILKGEEIDIYIPSLKVGLEINGVYWHSTKFKDPKYHSNKTLRAKEAGIHLYHIWEDWWVNRPGIIRSMILNWIGRSPRRIYARKCEIREVGRTEGMAFLEANHIQGKSSYEVGYGLYHEGELVSIMTFGRKRGCMGNNRIDRKSEEWELIRFCSTLYTNVVGGAGKLLQHFLRIHHPESIYSFSSCDISIGNLYNTLGFVSDGKVTLSYWYIDPETLRRYHRSSFTKNQIIRRGWKDTKDGWTERQVMEEHGYICIYDAGQMKWVLNPTNQI